MKTFTDIINEVDKAKSPADKKFVDMHKVEKIDKTPATDAQFSGGTKKDTSKAKKDDNDEKKYKEAQNDDKFEKTNEELTLEDFSLEEIKDFMESKEFEALDELSKKTLSSYVKKSARIAGRTEFRDGISSDDGKGPAAKKRDRDIKNRYKGIDRAVNKLAKESKRLSFKNFVGEEKENLDEDWREQNSRYSQRALSDAKEIVSYIETVIESDSYVPKYIGRQIEDLKDRLELDAERAAENHALAMTTETDPYSESSVGYNSVG